MPKEVLPVGPDVRSGIHRDKDSTETEAVEICWDSRGPDVRIGVRPGFTMIILDDDPIRTVEKILSCFDLDREQVRRVVSAAQERIKDPAKLITGEYVPTRPLSSLAFDIVYVGIWGRPGANHLIRLIRKARDRVWGADA